MDAALSLPSCVCMAVVLAEAMGCRKERVGERRRVSKQVWRYLSLNTFPKAGLVGWLGVCAGMVCGVTSLTQPGGMDHFMGL